MPDRDYYLKSDPKFVTIRDQLRVYAARVLDLAGVADPEGSASRVLAVENRLAGISGPPRRNATRRRPTTSSPSPMPLRKLQDWTGKRISMRRE